MIRKGQSLEDIGRDSRASVERLATARRARLRRLGMDSVLEGKIVPDFYGNHHGEHLRDARYLLRTQNEDILDWFMTREVVDVV